MKLLFFIFFALCSPAFAATWVTDGTAADVTAKHALASNGDTITLPGGQLSWTSGVSLTKAVHLQGTGSGRVVATGRISSTFGTGSKTFTIQSARIDGSFPISNGQTIRAWELATDKDSAYMLGTVTAAPTPNETFATSSSTDAYGADLTYGAGTNLVTGGTLSAAANDFEGFLGFKFTVGGSPITVTHLARRFITGNTQSHVVKIVRVSDSVEMASVAVDMVGGTNGVFKYQALGSSVVLAASTAYYVLSREYLGGDTYKYTTSTTIQAAATLNGHASSRLAYAFTLNVTTNTGSGTKSLWLFASEEGTRVTHNAGATVLLTLTESTAGSVEVSDIQFAIGSGTGAIIDTNSITNGQPILLHDLWWNMSQPYDMIHNSSCLQGVFWNLSVTWTYFAQSNSQFFHSNPNSRTEVWATTSKMGTDDTDGKQNIYIEDSDFHGAQGALDTDSNTRIVWRYCINNNAGVSSHGYDTSAFGNRHWQFYNNRFEYADVGAASMNLADHMLLRGGTGVIKGNFFEDVYSSVTGLKSEIQLGIWNLGRWGQSPGAYDADDGGVPHYPSPRQIGFGRVTGTGVDGQGNSTSNGVYVGDSEPIYIWSNTGFDPVISISTDGTPGMVNGYGHTPDDPADYFQLNRDYFVGTAKPGWTAYAYPHPLRGAAPGGSIGARKIGRGSTGGAPALAR